MYENCRITSAIAHDFLSACLYKSIKPQTVQGLHSSSFIFAASVALWNTLASAKNLLFIHTSMVKLICCLWLRQSAALQPGSKDYAFHTTQKKDAATCKFPANFALIYKSLFAEYHRLQHPLQRSFLLQKSQTAVI